VKKHPPRSKSDEIFNLQIVIDSLANEILNEDLSHINAQAIFADKRPDYLSIEYLLDIFKSLHEWLQNRLNSFNSSSSSTSVVVANKAKKTSSILSPIPLVKSDNHRENSFLSTTSSSSSSSVSFRRPSTSSTPAVKSKQCLESTSIKTTNALNYNNNNKPVVVTNRLHQYRSSSLSRIESVPRPVACLSRRHSKRIVEVCEKQEKLVSLMQRDLQDAKRIELLKEQRRVELEERAREREKKLHAIRLKQFRDDLTLKEQSKRLREETESYVQLKSNLSSMLKIKNEYVSEMKRYAREKSAMIGQRKLDELESIENMYQFKLDMMAEKLSAEKVNAATRHRDEERVHQLLNKQVAAKLDNDLREIQEAFFKLKNNLLFG
jgi:phospholipid N-methyltransferase